MTKGEALCAAELELMQGEMAHRAIVAAMIRGMSTHTVTPRSPDGSSSSAVVRCVCPPGWAHPCPCGKRTNERTNEGSAEGSAEGAAEGDGGAAEGAAQGKEGKEGKEGKDVKEGKEGDSKGEGKGGVGGGSSGGGDPWRASVKTMKTKFLEESLDAMRAFKCRNEEGKALLAVGKVLVKVRRAVQRVLEGGAVDPLKDALAAAATLEAMGSGGAVEQVAMRAAYVEENNVIIFSVYQLVAKYVQ